MAPLMATVTSAPPRETLQCN